MKNETNRSEQLDILLVNVGRKDEIRIPQGLLYLASALRQAGYKVKIHDEALFKNRQQSLEKILSYKTKFVGLNVYTVPWQLKRAEKLSVAIKNNMHSKVIWGGCHPSLYPCHCIRNKNVDIVVQGPGEKVICEFFDAMENNRPLNEIAGLAFKNYGRFFETGPADLDPKYLFPRLDFNLIDLKTYLDKHDRGKGILQYITSRGCYAKCRFCMVSRLFNRCFFRKHKEQIRQELQQQFREHHISAVHFSDDNTFRNDTEAVELCNIISSLTEGESIPWRCATRMDTLSTLSPGTYSRLAETGCKGFVVGIESGSDRMLKLMKKGVTISQIEKALKMLSEFGIDMNLFSFLFGFTGETKNEAKKTLSFARRVRLMFPFSDITLHVYFPGASDASWLCPDMSASQAARQSAMFSNYFANNLKTFQVG